MSVHRSAYLVAALLGVLASRGLHAEALDPWRGWVAFKQFAREVAEEPDPGVSVQIFHDDHGNVRLAFMRQVLEPVRDRLEPVGGVICDFNFAPRHRRPIRDWRVWSFDSASFDRFVDVVEQHPAVSDLLVTRPIDSAVYWEEA